MWQPQETNIAKEGLCWPAEGLDLDSQWEVSEGFWAGIISVSKRFGAGTALLTVELRGKANTQGQW